jgi:FtsP/CotA-like multicopper oxidase with cupredoxin domain
MDGANGVSQGPILPGESFTYEFLAYPAGSHWYHSHMDAVQASAGVKGSFVVKKHNDPYKEMYDEDLIVHVSDEWREPGVCLRLEGAMAGNDVCADIRHASYNGQYGDGTAAYPYPLIDVEQGKCYRVRYIFTGANTENLIIKMAGHNMTLIAKDGHEIKPMLVTSFNMHLGERYDVIVCADQEPGNYLISGTYDYACTLTPGNFIPPGFSPVPACEFYAFLHYKGHNEKPKNQHGSPNQRPPLGSGGGRNPSPVSGIRYDLTEFKSWHVAKPRVEEEPEPEEPDVRYTINIGLNGPTYSAATDLPLSKGRYYMDLDGPNGGNRRSWHHPQSPLYMSKGQCGVGDIPILNVPETAKTVEVVVNNLSPAAHVLHLHGMQFKVINYANYEWCNLNRTDW